jgi:HicB family
MDLTRYVDDIRHQLAVAAETGGADARALAERLYTPLEPAVRLALQEVLAQAAEEITTELAPGSVEVRLRGREPELVVTLPPVEPGPAQPADSGPAAGAALGAYPTGDAAGAGEVARINLRLPEPLKERVERAAAVEGLSVNTWLVRVAAAAVDRSDPRRDLSPPQGQQRLTGWAR